MGLFNRQPRNGPVIAPNAAAANGHGNRAHREPYTMMTRPSFGQWVRATWLDIVTMAAMGAIGLGVYWAKPAPTRSFAVTFTDGEVVYPEFAYPMRKEIIPIWLAAFLASIIPIFLILVMQVRIRSFWDANNAIIGLLYSLITAAVFQVFVKWLIGGLRPHFLTVCQPDVSLASNAPGITGEGYNAKGFTQIYYTREICTGDQKEINDSLESMPSGHTTAAFAGFVYLSLYLNAKLKVFSNYHPAMWKLVAIWAPILGACLIGGALTIDEFHNWYDILAGATIGTVMAFSAYRMTYASIWDWRWNHIPLSRVTPLPYGGAPELAGATFTRRVGWGASGAGFPFTGEHGFAGDHLHNGHHNGHHDAVPVGSGANGGGVFTRKPVGPGGVRGAGDNMV
ncbi:phosphatidic acid phosphatase type 2/haloperoxidase [Lasiosphaeria ovina]|uniref:Phosphatidic acid phosphatase type 2/haloperoxidase n=1 Tax=Lasiosphaeria ovina TaxID=92902 RepID=A0AAE0KBG2_9PEZI|nr:phosphatidic acid phosphatase type 2/haloperoxidase [Lasiosphaeria ovina]